MKNAPAVVLNPTGTGGKRPGWWAPPPLWDAALVLLVGTVAAGFYLHRSDISLWYDEAFSLGLVNQDWRVFWTYVWGPESNMTLYYLVLRGWLRLTAWFGLAPVEWVARMPSVVFGALGVVVVFLLGKRWGSRLAGVTAAGLFATNLLQMTQAPQARAYSLQLLLIAIAWYALLAALTGPPTRLPWWGLLAGANALAVYTHLFSVFAMAAEVCAFATLLLLPGPWRAPARGAIKAFGGSMIAASLLLLPLVYDVRLHGGAQLGIPPAHLGDLHRFFSFISGNNRVYEALVPGFALLAVAAAALPFLPRKGGIERHAVAPLPLGPTVAFASWLGVPLLLSFAVTQRFLNLHVFFNRYLVVVVPALCLLAALGLAALPSRAARLAVVLVLTGAAWPQVPFHYAVAQVQDFRSPTRWLQQQFQEGDGLICFPDNAACAIPVEYYLRAYPAPAHFASGFPGGWSWDPHRSTAVDGSSIEAYTAAHRRIFLVYAPLGLAPPDTETRARALQNWLDARYALVAQSQTIASASTIAVRLYAAQRAP